MPSMTMYGWPDAGGLKMSESAETPEITLSFDLFITGSSPSFGYLGFDSQVNTYKAEIAAPTESLDRIQIVGFRCKSKFRKSFCTDSICKVVMQWQRQFHVLQIHPNIKQIGLDELLGVSVKIDKER